MSKITFTATPYSLDTWLILKLPESASAQLPSRGMVMVEGTLNGHHFTAPLEPDGQKSHWLQIDSGLRKSAKVSAGTSAHVEIEPMKDWPEPTVPKDLHIALTASPKAHSIWKDITPMARWDWIRWINGTKVAKTRAHRIDVAISKLNTGSRRPCCFNRSECTVPDVSHQGVLMGADSLSVA